MNSVLAIVLLAFVTVSHAQVGTIAQNFEQWPLHVRVQLCLQDGDKVSAAKCVAAQLGNDAKVAGEKVKELLTTGAQDVKDFLTTQSQKVKDFIGKHDGVFDSLSEKAKEYASKAQSWWDEHFGSQKTKRQVGNIAAAWAQLPLHSRIQMCLEGSSSKTEAAKCAAANLGADFQTATENVKDLLKTGSEKVKEFLSAQGEKIKEFIGEHQGTIDSITGKAKELKDKAQAWWDEHFGGQKTVAKRQVGNIAAAWSQLPLWMKIQMCMEGSSSKAEAFKCAKANVGAEILAAGNKVESLLEKGSQAVKDFWHEHFGKTKRQATELAWYPTGDEISVARRVKFCIDSNFGDLTTCIQKVLGAKADTVDPLKVQTIINYENVLKELKEWISDANQKGMTMQQYLAYKKANRGKRQTDIAWYPTPDEVHFAQRVKECMEKNRQDINTCIKTILGDKENKVDPMKVQTIINYENVLKELKEWITQAKDLGMTMQQYLAYRKEAKAALAG